MAESMKSSRCFSNEHKQREHAGLAGIAMTCIYIRIVRRFVMLAGWLCRDGRLDDHGDLERRPAANADLVRCGDRFLFP